MSDVITDLLRYTGTKTVVSETVSGVQGTGFRCCLTCLVVLGEKNQILMVFASFQASAAVYVRSSLLCVVT